MQPHDDLDSAVEVFFRFQVKDPETGQPYTVTISQEGIVREGAADVGSANDYDRCYQSHVNADLQVELLSDAPAHDAAPGTPVPRPTIQGHHDLRQLLHQ